MSEASSVGESAIARSAEQTAVTPPCPGGGWQRRAWRAAATVMVFGAALHAVLLTLDDLGMTFDEPTYMTFERRQREWWALVGQAVGIGGGRAAGGAAAEALSLGELFHPDVLRLYWDVEGGQDHPVAGRQMANLSYAVLRPAINLMYGWAGVKLDRWLSARLATGVLFAALVAVMFRSIGSRYGQWAGLAAAASLVFMPRVFGEAHFDTQDLPLAAWWYFAFCTFFRAVERGRAGVGFGICAGLAAATKFPGLFVPLPLAVWAIVYRERRAVRPLLLALPIMVAVLVVVDPHWWWNPVEGLGDYVRRSVFREKHFGPLDCYYLGGYYLGSLPWHNALVLAAATVPPGILALGLVGLTAGAWKRPRDRFSAGLSVVFVFWIVMRALPFSPDHDGVRLYLPAFVFLAALVGVGSAAVGGWVRGAWAGRRGQVAAVGVPLLLVAWGGWDLARIHPYELAYYSPAVGGPAGARRLGLETTYWFDAMTPEVLGWLNRLPGGTAVYVPWTPTLPTLVELGYVGRHLDVAPEKGPEWIVLLMRQSNFNQAIVPASRYPQTWWEVVRALRPYKTWATRDGVPLLGVYRAEDVQRLLSGSSRNGESAAAQGGGTR